MKSEFTIEQHVNSNLAMAIDQCEEYKDFISAILSYARNCYDSCIEDNYNKEEAFLAWRLYLQKASQLDLI